MIATLTRRPITSTETIGDLIVKDKFGALLLQAVTLELLDKENQKRISCVPAGEYLVKIVFSQKFNFVYELQNVPNRSKIYIHAGNTNIDTSGCILLGSHVRDVLHTNSKMIINSRSTIREFLMIMPKSFNLKII
jgi:hypothetical protein